MTSLENNKIFFVHYKDALAHEQDLNRQITLFDSDLRRILKKKDGTFGITPILYVHGSDKELSTYDTTLIRKNGFLALEITEKEADIFDPDDVMCFEFNGKDYKKIESHKEEYTALDYEFKGLLPTADFPLLRVQKSSGPWFTIERNPVIPEVKIPDEVELLKKQSMGSGLYLEVDEDSIPLEYKPYITRFVRGNNGEFTPIEMCNYLIAYTDPSKLKRSVKKQYLNLVKNGVPVGVKRLNEQSFRIHMYNLRTKQILQKHKYKLMYVLRTPEVLKLLGSAQLHEQIRGLLFESHKMETGYSLEVINRQKKTEIYDVNPI